MNTCRGENLRIIFKVFELSQIQHMDAYDVDLFSI